LTLAQEMQRWSLMTMLYLVICYVGIPYSVYVNRGQKVVVVLMVHLSLSVLAFCMQSECDLTIGLGST
ncbi:uncharacterized protein F5147DRAFT_691945, partial [Suillus discolor]